uniref:BI1-like protein n=1 Tax=Triticum urartu TaxID=4572 RepID=A0A8R7U2K1_TRIUA
MKGGGDIEAGTAVPKGTTESPELRWALIRKIYVVLCLQLLLTAAVAVVFVKVSSIPRFFVSSYAGLGLYVFILVFPFVVLCPLHIYRQKHPINLLLLGVFTVAISFSVGLTCAFTSGTLSAPSFFLSRSAAYVNQHMLSSESDSSCTIKFLSHICQLLACSPCAFNAPLIVLIHYISMASRYFRTISFLLLSYGNCASHHVRQLIVSYCYCEAFCLRVDWVQKYIRCQFAIPVQMVDTARQPM